MEAAEATNYEEEASENKSSMNKSKVKSYAIGARKDFVKAVSDKALRLGLSAESILDQIENKNEIATLSGDVTIIQGREYPKKVYKQHQKLVMKVRDYGSGLTIDGIQSGLSILLDEVAYSWFNRFVALRFMELHHYLDYMVLSNNNESLIPEILDKADHVDLSGLNKEKVRKLLLESNKEEEVYKLLLIAQCNNLNESMPFLFERIDDETELLLPDNLLAPNSLIQKLVKGIDENDWQQVEIIGWIYQYYISERKDEIFAAKKAYKTKDIPAATQLFTPNWIVKYMTQNSIGRQWLDTYPDSPLKSKMEYYITPAEQDEEVKRQLAEITPTEINPEKVTVFDPACGSGHILVEAYDLLKEIYLERGYVLNDIPKMILEKNLYGLDIDIRAAQLAGFVLLMKAREDNQKILRKGNAPRLNIHAIQESNGMNIDDIANNLLQSQTYKLTNDDDLFPETLAQQSLMSEEKSEVSRDDIKELLECFVDAKTYGSLISIPENVTRSLKAISELVRKKVENGNMYERNSAEDLEPFVNQAILLAAKYDNVIANPPYMRGGKMDSKLKSFAKSNFPESKTDLFSMFFEHCLDLTKQTGFLGFMSPFVWMFIASYEDIRKILIDESTITSLIQLQYSAFAEADVPICTFTLQAKHFKNYTGSYIRLTDFKGANNQAIKTLEAIKTNDCGWFYNTKPDEFKKIPGRPIAYWVSDKVRDAYLIDKIEDSYEVKEGTGTRDDNRFLREFWEVSLNKIRFKKENEEKWVPVDKAGGYRKWYGSIGEVMNWRNDGKDIKEFPKSCIRNTKYFFEPAVSWGKVGSGTTSFRKRVDCFAFVDAAPSAFGDKLDLLISALNSVAIKHLLKVQGGTLNVTVGIAKSLPLPDVDIKNIPLDCIKIARNDWDSYETSWNFRELPLLDSCRRESSLVNAYNRTRSLWQDMITEIQKLEEENNRIFIEAYGLEDELTPDVPISEITLTCNPYYRYKSKKNESEIEASLLTDTIKELISYSIGCMMGRYSLDHKGLVYADANNEGFGAANYTLFPADDDGIIPITDEAWFEDDATKRFEEFLTVCWDQKTLSENMAFVASNLKPKKGESSSDTIRRYMSGDFYKDHIKTYKKRPIYWLFSSGSGKAFECLVYLHRYNEGTLSRIRMDYVSPLQGKFNRRMEDLQIKLDSADSTAETRRVDKEILTLESKIKELNEFDQKLRNYADKRIAIDLDDGVKVNYDKFGDLLKDVKAITGKKA